MTASLQTKVVALLLRGSDAAGFQAALAEFHDNIRSGNLFPLWSQHARFGYGSPALGWLPPLQLYVAEFFRLLGAQAPAAMALTVLTAQLAGAAGAFALVRMKFPKREAALGAALFFLAPCFLKGIRADGLFSGAFYFPALPWFVYFALRAASKPGRKTLLGFALSCAALAAGHAGVFLLVLPLAAFATFLYRKKIRSLPAFLAAAAMGFCCASFYLLETFVEAPAARSAPALFEPQKTADNLAEFTHGRGDVLCSRTAPTRIDCDIMAIQHASLRFNIFDDPGWTLSENGDTIAKRPESGGRILVDLQPGKQHLTAVLRNTPLRVLVKFLSIAALLGCFVFPFRKSLLSVKCMPKWLHAK